jgi:hypothetical protein
MRLDEGVSEPIIMINLKPFCASFSPINLVSIK